MKKSKVVKKLMNDLKISEKKANKIVAIVEASGMLPPWSKQRDMICECGCRGTCPRGNEWDSEHLADNANQSWR